MMGTMRKILTRRQAMIPRKLPEDSEGPRALLEVVLAAVRAVDDRGARVRRLGGIALPHKDQVQPVV